LLGAVLDLGNKSHESAAVEARAGCDGTVVLGCVDRGLEGGEAGLQPLNAVAVAAVSHQGVVGLAVTDQLPCEVYPARFGESDLDQVFAEQDLEADPVGETERADQVAQGEIGIAQAQVGQAPPPKHNRRSPLADQVEIDRFSWRMRMPASKSGSTRVVR
jgi:hypothetical protein